MNSLAPINDINLKIFDEIYHITGNEGWLQALSETEKRSLIKSSIKMHRYKGTKYAIEEIFKTLNIVGNVEEWFNYGGKPIFFKLFFKYLIVQ